MSTPDPDAVYPDVEASVRDAITRDISETLDRFWLSMCRCGAIAYAHIDGPPPGCSGWRAASDA